MKAKYIEWSFIQAFMDTYMPYNGIELYFNFQFLNAIISRVHQINIYLQSREVHYSQYCKVNISPNN